MCYYSLGWSEGHIGSWQMLRVWSWASSFRTPFSLGFHLFFFFFWVFLIYDCGCFGFVKLKSFWWFSLWVFLCAGKRSRMSSLTLSVTEKGLTSVDLWVWSLLESLLLETFLFHCHVSFQWEVHSLMFLSPRCRPLVFSPFLLILTFPAQSSGSSSNSRSRLLNLSGSFWWCIYWPIISAQIGSWQFQF